VPLLGADPICLLIPQLLKIAGASEVM